MVVYENMKQKIIAKYMTKFIPIKKETEVKRKDGMNKHSSRHYIKKNISEQVHHYKNFMCNSILSFFILYHKNQ